MPPLCSARCRSDFSLRTKAFHSQKSGFATLYLSNLSLSDITATLPAIKTSLSELSSTLAWEVSDLIGQGAKERGCSEFRTDLNYKPEPIEKQGSLRKPYKSTLSERFRATLPLPTGLRSAAALGALSLAAVIIYMALSAGELRATDSAMIDEHIISTREMSFERMSEPSEALLLEERIEYLLPDPAETDPVQVASLEKSVVEDFSETETFETDLLEDEEIEAFEEAETFEDFDSIPLEDVINLSRGSTETRELAITFDGGSSSNHATEILDILKERGIETTFFITGGFIKRYPRVVRRMVSEGHEVGNHTQTHPHLTDYPNSYRHRTLEHVTRDFVVDELLAVEDLFYKTTGTYMAPYWRAPFGEVNAEISRWAFDAGYTHVGWTADHVNKRSLDTHDWITDQSHRLYKSPREIKDKIVGFDRYGSGLRGGIILMHLGTDRGRRSAAVKSLGAMIDEITDKGYRFVKVSRLVTILSQNKRNEKLAAYR